MAVKKPYNRLNTCFSGSNGIFVYLMVNLGSVGRYSNGTKLYLSDVLFYRTFSQKSSTSQCSCGFRTFFILYHLGCFVLPPILLKIEV